MFNIKKMLWNYSYAMELFRYFTISNYISLNYIGTKIL